MSIQNLIHGPLEHIISLRTSFIEDSTRVPWLTRAHFLHQSPTFLVGASEMGHMQTTTREVMFLEIFFFLFSRRAS
jgi:hypothetical protein